MNAQSENGRSAQPRGGGGGGGRKRKQVFDSYYGRPIVREATWESRDIAGYFFLGGLAGASSVLAAGAQLTGRPALARPLKLGAAGAIQL
jgi:hypothetical protein